MEEAIQLVEDFTSNYARNTDECYLDMAPLS